MGTQKSTAQKAAEHKRTSKKPSDQDYMPPTPAPIRKSAILSKLNQKGLPTKFDGRDVDQYKLDELKKLVKTFCIDGYFSLTSDGIPKSKQDHCVTLMSIKSTPLTDHEQEVIAAVLDEGNPKTTSNAWRHLRKLHYAGHKWYGERSCGSSSRFCMKPESDAPGKAEFPETTSVRSDHCHWEFESCVVCLRHWIMLGPMVVEDLTRIPCPEYGCNAFLDETYMRHASPEVYKRYLKQVEDHSQV